MPELAKTEPGKAIAPIGAAGADQQLSGAQRALLFLLSIDEGIASSIMANMSEDDLRLLRKASDQLSEVKVETIAAVHKEFYDKALEGVPQPMKGSSQYLKRLAGKAMGDAKAADIWSEKQGGAVEELARLDVTTVVSLLENEQPQTIAVVLSELETNRAAEVMKFFAPEKQAEIVLRMTRLKSVPASVIEEIEQHFRAEIAQLGKVEQHNIEGMGSAASLLKRLPSDQSDQLIEQLAQTDNALASELKKLLFTFEDLIRIEGRGMQVFLQEVATPQLVLALKTASDELKDKIFGNVSARAGAMLRDELEMLGPVRLADVEAAQRAAVEIALNLEKEGRITITREGGGDFV